MPTPPKTRARWVRGTLVGVSSAVTTLGAHAAAGGMLPQGSALVLALLLCATVGAVSCRPRTDGHVARWAAPTAALFAAQYLGHLALSVTGHHHASVDLTPGAAMLAAHLGAAVLLGAAIAAVEYLYAVCASVLCWLRLFALRAGRPTVRVRRHVTKVVVARPVLTTGLGMRAPPAPAAV